MLSEQQKKALLRLRTNGLTVLQAADAVGCSRTTAWRVLKNGGSAGKRRPGRPKTHGYHNGREHKAFMTFVRKQLDEAPAASAAAIHRRWRRRRTISYKTFLRMLRTNFYWGPPKAGVLLDKKARAKRKEWCEKFIHADYSNWVHCDAAKFTVCTSQKSLEFLKQSQTGGSWQQKGKRRRCVKLGQKLRKNFPAVKLMVAVLPMPRGPPVVVAREYKGTLNSESLRPIYRSLSQRFRALRPRRKICLVQDNCRVQNSLAMKDYCRGELSWDLANLPPYSPDLSALDGAVFACVKACLNRSLTKTLPRSRAEFRARLMRTLTCTAVRKVAGKFLANYQGRIRQVVDNDFYVV